MRTISATDVNHPKVEAPSHHVDKKRRSEKSPHPKVEKPEHIARSAEGSKAMTEVQFFIKSREQPLTCYIISTEDRDNHSIKCDDHGQQHS
jgi:hypothetical protein